MEQGKRLCERRVSVKAGTGRRSEVTSEGKDFPKPPSAKQQPRPGNATENGPLPAAIRKALQGLWRQRRRRRSPWRYDLSGMWRRVYCMWTDTFVMSDTTTGRWDGRGPQAFNTWDRTRTVYSVTHVHDSWHARKIRFTLRWFIWMTNYSAYVNRGGRSVLGKSGLDGG